MRNRINLLAGLAVIVMAGGVLMINADLHPNKHFDAKASHKSQKETQEIAGYYEYVHKLSANQHTGEINPADVMSARNQADKVSSNYKKSRALSFTWEERGPDNIGGRTRAMVADQNVPGKLYMGAVGGGFFVSTDRGNNWTKRVGNDRSPAISVSAMCQAANGDIYYGTGEGITFASSTTWIEQIFQLGEGVFKSSDGGATFTQLPSTIPTNTNGQAEAWVYTNKLVAHPTDANKIFAANQRGLYKTTDGGATWSKPTGLTSFNGKFLDIAMSPSGNIILASTVNNLYISTDGGDSFGLGQNTQANGLPGAVSLSRFEVAYSPSDENTAYAVLAANTGSLQGVYKSVNGGANWTAIAQGGSQVFNPLGNQGGYNIALGVHPTNPDMIFLGGQLELYRYTTASGWTPIAYWVQSPQNGKYVHADMHGIHFSHTNPDEMYVVNDGGFFRTDDCTLPEPFFHEKNKNYNTIQCYSVAANKFGSIVFGTQDNGTNTISGYSNSVQTSKRQMGGDGTRCYWSDFNPSVIFGSIVNGEFRRATDGGANASSWKNILDENVDADQDGEPDEGGNWVSPLYVKEKFDASEADLHKSVGIIGLNNRVWMAQNPTKVAGTVLTWFPLFTQNNSRFTSIAMSDDGQVVYAGTSNGRIYRITGIDLYNTTYKYDGPTEILLTEGFSMGAGFVVTQIGALGRHITDLECDATGNVLVATMPHYGNTSYVFRSANARSAASPNFTNIQNNLPYMPVYSVAFMNGSTTDMVVGTDLGVWGTDNAGATWTEVNNQTSTDESMIHPRVATYEVVVKETLEDQATGAGMRGNILYTGTHGRGTFMSSSDATQWAVGTNDIAKTTELSVYPNPVADATTVAMHSELNSTASIKVTDLKGRVIKHFNAGVQKGQNKIRLDLSSLSAGAYILNVNAAGQIGTSRIIKR